MNPRPEGWGKILYEHQGYLELDPIALWTDQGDPVLTSDEMATDLTLPLRFAKLCPVQQVTVASVLSEKNRNMCRNNIFICTVVVTVVLIFFSGCKNEKQRDAVEQVKTTDCSRCPKMESGQDTLTFVNDVRRFVSERCDMGLMPNAYCDTFARIPIHEFEVDSYLILFDRDEGTATCGLAALIMVKILLENGLDAYTYNFGFNNTRLSHVVVLVKRKGKLLIFDPYMNYELLNADGNNMDLETLLGNIAVDSVDLRFSTDTVESDMLITFRALQPQYLALLDRPECAEILENAVEIRDSIFRYTIKRCFACEASATCTSFVRDFEQKLSNETDYNTFHQGFALKINEIYGAPDHRRINAYIDSVIAHTPGLTNKLSD